MKRLLLFSALLLTACHASRPHFTVGVSQCSDDAWRQKMNNEMQTEALLYDNLELEIRSAGGDSERQIADIRHFIEQGVDLLIVAPNEAIPVTPVVEEAYARGIPVIVVDRKILSDHYTAYIGADNYRIGKIIGEYVASQLGGRGEVIELTGLSGSTPAIDRHQGFVNALKNHPGIRVLCSEDAHWLRSDAEVRADSLYRIYPEVDLVFAHNDQMALGAWQAAGHTPGGRTVDVVGIDGLPGPGNGIEMVRSGVFKASFIYPTGGERIIATAAAILRGEPFERETLLSTAIVDRTNATVLDMQSSEIIAQQQQISRLKSLADSYLLRYSTQRAISWFSLVSLLLIAVISALLGRSLRIKSRLNRILVSRNDEINSQKDRLEQQRDQLVALSRQLEEATQAKLIFFTNISHDLKTPLTLVVDPLKQLKEHLPANAPGNAYVHLIEKNVGRIQRMISQLLQFREIESQKITLNRQPGDLIRFIDSIFSLFEFYANKKGIETGFNSQYESFYTKFDHDVIEKIFTNLFSNAIKYASENGYVGVRIYPARQDQRPESAPPAAGTEYIAFTVTNTGAEIPDDKKETIFESFNHLSDRRPQFESSSGLGLAIVKELVGNLNGTITLRSGNSKVAFTVVLPFTLNAEKTDSAAESYEYTVSEIDNLLTESDVMAPNDRHDRKACNIVVIEDDPNLRSYLEQRLSKHYNVYTAANGSEGIAKAERICPQIVITDLMMPEADGFEVCRSLRSNIKTSHIPVIMLSALGKNTENKIKALECGANVFIDKPFDMDFLLKQVANLIRSQQELKERYSKKYIAEPSKITISSMDEELLKKAMNYIERNMDNSDYNVDSFVSDMSIGRTLLYQKINDITGMSIKEFIMDVRLKRSAQLLRESDLTISEISVLTGFANPKYFSICFKRHFELTPSEFKKKS